jgi:hypothetical protein
MSRGYEEPRPIVGDAAEFDKDVAGRSSIPKNEGFQ